VLSAAASGTGLSKNRVFGQVLNNRFVIARQFARIKSAGDINVPKVSQRSLDASATIFRRRVAKIRFYRD
jgi:hypothetical protein